MNKEKAQNFINKGKIIDKKLIIRYIIGICLLFLVFLLLTISFRYYLMGGISLIVFSLFVTMSIISIKMNFSNLAHFFLIYFFSSIFIVVSADLIIYLISIVDNGYSPTFLLIFILLQTFMFFVYLLLLDRDAKKEKLILNNAIPYFSSSVNFILFMVIKLFIKDLPEEQMLSTMNIIIITITIFLLYESAVMLLKYFYTKKYDLTGFDNVKSNKQ